MFNSGRTGNNTFGQIWDMAPYDKSVYHDKLFYAVELRKGSNTELS